MRLRQIEVFHAVYTTGSMTSAAAVLHVSQPSISKVLAHAEQQLGYPLFERVKGKLIATPEAHRLFGHVATVYQNIDQLRHVSRNLRSSDSGRIRIAATPAFGIDLLPSAIASYQAMHGETVFEIETLHHHEITEALLQSRVDIGLAFSPGETPGIARETLADAEFVVLSPADMTFGDKHAIGIEDMLDRPFIGLNSRGPLGGLLETYLDSSNHTLKVVASSETYHVAKALVASGAGITIIDEITARSSGHENAVRRPLKPSLQFEIAVLHFANVPLSIVCRRFIDHLRSCIDDFLRR